MKMAGGGEMVQYPAADERTHPQGPEPDWQESYLLVWWDAANAIGGHFRIGHEPNRNGGQALLWAQVHVAGRSYFRNSTLPITAADWSENGIGAGNGGLVYSYDGHCKWTLEDKDISLAVDLEDFHPAIDGYIKDGKLHLGTTQAHHVEVACRVTGKVTAHGKTHAIDGLGMRDHAWGKRNWDDNRAHRWVVGMFDRDNSFCAVTMQMGNSVIARFGWVVRGEEVIYADQTEIISYIMADGLTNVGGTLRMKLSTGEDFSVRFAPLAPCALFHHPRGLCCVDTLSTVTWGERVGVGIFESSFNLQTGTVPPKGFDGGIASNGWQPQRN